MKNLFASISFVLFFSLLVNGQIVNIESQRLAQDSAGFSGLAKIDFYGVSKTSTLYRIDFGSKMQYRKGNSVILSINNLRYNISSSAVIESYGFQHFRYNYMLNKFLVPEVFTQIQYDQILDIDLRWLIGAGTKFVLLKNDAGNIDIGVAYMYEYEDEGGGSTLINRDHRMSTYLSMGVNLGKVFSFNTITYYQPRLDFFADSRISSGNSLGIKLNKHFTFSTGLNLVYDSYPVEVSGIPNLSTVLTSGIVVMF